MGLRRALALLPDDRDTLAVARDVIGYLDSHARRTLTVREIAHGTCRQEAAVGQVLTALAEGLVVDCDGDPHLSACSYRPDPVLALEVQRFLRTSLGATSHLQRGASRYRERLGPH